MQKHLIAAALTAAFAAPLFASAQSSNVTIYGTIRLGMESIRATGATAAGGNLSGRSRMVDSDSALGFKGTEDLGNGLKAFWQIEQALVPDGQHDVGSNGGQGWATRNSAIGLRGNFGKFMMGRWDTYDNAHEGISEKHLGRVGAAFKGRALLSKVNRTTAVGGRRANTLTYTTPNMSGFTGRLQYSTGHATEVRAGAADESIWSLTLGYVNGPLGIQYAHYNHQDVGNVNNLRYRGDKLSAAYTFSGTTTLGVTWERLRVQNFAAASHTAAGNNNLRRNAYLITLAHKFGNNTIAGTYGRASNGTGSAGALGVGNNTGASYFQLSYAYDFSKRTNAYVGFARVNNKRNAFYDFHSNGGIGLAAANAGADPQTFQAGLVHRF